MKIRKNLLIYPIFQKKLLFYNILICGSMLVLMGLTSILTYYKYSQLGLQANLPKDHPYYEFLSAYLIDTLKLSTFVFIILSIASSYIYLKLSNQIAGPILRLKSYFQNFSSSEKQSKLRFRHDDYFSDLPDDINNALDRWGKISQD